MPGHATAVCTSPRGTTPDRCRSRPVCTGHIGSCCSTRAAGHTARRDRSRNGTPDTLHRRSCYPCRSRTSSSCGSRCSSGRFRSSSPSCPTSTAAHQAAGGAAVHPVVDGAAEDGVARSAGGVSAAHRRVSGSGPQQKSHRRDGQGRTDDGHAGQEAAAARAGVEQRRYPCRQRPACRGAECWRPGVFVGCVDDRHGAVPGSRSRVCSTSRSRRTRSARRAWLPRTTYRQKARPPSWKNH